MKVTSKTHRFSIALTYAYIALILFLAVLRFTETDLSRPLETSKAILLQGIFVWWFIYLGRVLSTHNQPKAGVLAFTLYGILNISGFSTLFMNNFEDIRTFSLISGALIFFAQIFLIIQTFRLKGTVISKYYRLLGIILGSITVVRMGLPVIFTYVSEYYAPDFYRSVWLYTDTYSLLLPVTIIILLKRTTPLLSDYVEPATPHEEYL